MYMIEDMVPFNFTLAVLSVRKLDIHLVRLIGKSSFASLSLRPSCHLVSNAFCMSKSAIIVAKPLNWVACCIGVITRQSWSVISMPGLNSAWLWGANFE